MALPNLAPNTDPHAHPDATAWHALELSTTAVPALWQRRCGEKFERFREAALRVGAKRAKTYPCHVCGLNMAVSIQAPDNIIALCNECPQNCQGMHLTAEDIEVLELDVQKLAGRLCQGFGFTPRASDAALHNTYQIGSWSADNVPVFLTIQHERFDFEHVVMTLVARYRRKFILLGPTSNHLGATCEQILSDVGAGFFPLDSNVIITDDGRLLPTTTPGKLFADFSPQSTEPLPEDEARRVFAIVLQLDSAIRTLPSVLTVLRFYCIEELSAAEVAQKCRCSKTAVMRRLAIIKAKTGRHPADLRRLSVHLNKIDEDLTDSRAKEVYRRGAIHGEEGSAENSG